MTAGSVRKYWKPCSVQSHFRITTRQWRRSSQYWKSEEKRGKPSMNVRDKDLFWWSFPFLIPHKLTTASDFQVVYQALNCGS